MTVGAAFGFPRAAKSRRSLVLVVARLEAGPFPNLWVPLRSYGLVFQSTNKDQEQQQSQRPRARVPALHGQLHPLVLPQLMHL
jgi:hypothetical protein